MLDPYLEDLENRLDPEAEDLLLARWHAFLDGGAGDGAFSPRRPRPAPPALDWPAVPVNDALENPELMVLQQLAACSAVLEKGDGAVLNVRANFGTGIMPSLFGAEMFFMERAQNTLPTARPLPGGERAIRELLARGVPDLRGGFGGRCFEVGALFRSLFAAYPKISRYIHHYHPDLQGPMDVAELLWGSSLFIALVDDPDLVGASLELITGTYIRFLREWESLFSARPPDTVHWGILFRGRVMIRDDSAMNLSPAMFDEFIRPFDQRLLEEFGGGAVHFCGRGDHYIDRLCSMKGLNAVHLSQPECNDMETVFRHTVDRGIALLALRREAAERALAAGRPLHGRVHCP